MQVCFINNLQGKKMKIYARVFPHTFPIHRKITPIISKSTPKKIEYTLNPNTAIDIQKPLRPATHTHTHRIFMLNTFVTVVREEGHLSSRQTTPNSSLLPKFTTNCGYYDNIEVCDRFCGRGAKASCHCCRFRPTSVFEASHCTQSYRR